MPYTIRVLYLFYFETLELFDYSNFIGSALTGHKSLKILF